jgi:hypothetical protein
MDEDPYFHIVFAFEAALEDLTGFTYDVVPPGALPPGIHGETRPDEKMVLIAQDVYDGAVDGRGRDRMTMAHEFGHALLHGDVRLARRMGNDDVEAFRDPEWQAKAFAGELLVCYRHFKPGMNEADVAVTFGVSEDAARQILKGFRKDGLLVEERGCSSQSRSF